MVVLDIAIMYAEVNQLAAAKASKSSAILDCVVVTSDKFEAENDHQPYSSATSLPRMKEHTLQKHQSTQTQHNQQPPRPPHMLIRLIPILFRVLLIPPSRTSQRLLTPVIALNTPRIIDQQRRLFSSPWTRRP